MVSASSCLMVAGKIEIEALEYSILLGEWNVHALLMRYTASSQAQGHAFYQANVLTRYGLASVISMVFGSVSTMKTPGKLIARC